MWVSKDANLEADTTLRSILHSLAEAGSQEVKTSNELKEAVALLMNMLKRLWDGCATPPADVEATVFYETFGRLVNIAVECLGASLFAEDVLTTSNEDSVEAALTPSNRSSKHHRAPRSSFVFLFGFLYNPPPALHNAAATSDGLSNTLLTLLMSAKPTSASQIDLITRSLDVWSSTYAADAADVQSGRLWADVANQTVVALRRNDNASNNDESQTLGNELRNCMRILQHGLSYISSSPKAMSGALSLYDALHRVSKQRAGTAGAVIAVVEPLAKSLNEEVGLKMTTKLELAIHMIETISWPRARQEFDHARKALWGVALAPHKANSFDPFDHLYRLIVGTLTESYNGLLDMEAEDRGKINRFLGATSKFLSNCPLSHVVIATRRTQDGLMTWLEDRHRDAFATPALASQVRFMPISASRRGLTMRSCKKFGNIIYSCLSHYHLLIPQRLKQSSHCSQLASAVQAKLS